jgi:soluble lytic murein transglycosylase-like protein
LLNLACFAPRAALPPLFILMSLGIGTVGTANADSSQPKMTGPTVATVDLAERYEVGESVPRDYRRALALYCQAARNGDPRAYFALGWMHLNGRGVPRDDISAAMWLRKAASHGIPQATNLLALLPATSARGTDRCSTALAPSLANAIPPAEVRALIGDAAVETGLDPALLTAVMSVESGFNPRAVSPKLAAGLMQLMPDTAVRFGVQDAFDAKANVLAGATYLHSLLQTFHGDITLALAAYNAGEAAVLSHGGVPPYKETNDYVAAVKRLCGCDNGLSIVKSETSDAN